MIIAAWVIALFFAVNIGASGTAASIGAAYGAGAIRHRWIALAIVSIAAYGGAIVGGGAVVKTIGGGLIPAHETTAEITVLILVSACLTLFLANILGIPLSTSEVTVGAIVGVGLAIGHVYAAKLMLIVSVWLVMPFFAMLIGFLLGKLVRNFEHHLTARRVKTVRVLTALLIVAGAYESFSAGTNNVANAIGPLVSAHIVPLHSGLLIGAVFVSLGAFVLGGRVLDTNAKRITKLTLLQGSAVSFTSGTLVVIASMFGLPVPQTQATTMAIFGIGQSHMGRNFWQQDVVKRILRMWIASPLSSLLLSYLMVEGLIYHHWTTLFIVISSISVGVLYWQGRTPVKKFRPSSSDYLQGRHYRTRGERCRQRPAKWIVRKSSLSDREGI